VIRVADVPIFLLSPVEHRVCVLDGKHTENLSKRGHSTTLHSARGIVMFPSLLSNGGRSQPVEWAA